MTPGGDLFMRKQDLQRQINELLTQQDQAKTIEEWLALEQKLMELREQYHTWVKTDDGHDN